MLGQLEEERTPHVEDPQEEIHCLDRWMKIQKRTLENQQINQVWSVTTRTLPSSMIKGRTGNAKRRREEHVIPIRFMKATCTMCIKHYTENNKKNDRDNHCHHDSNCPSIRCCIGVCRLIRNIVEGRVCGHDIKKRRQRSLTKYRGTSRSCLVPKINVCVRAQIWICGGCMMYT